jgi:hypothetical protein
MATNARSTIIVKQPQPVLFVFRATVMAVTLVILRTRALPAKMANIKPIKAMN